MCVRVSDRTAEHPGVDSVGPIYISVCAPGKRVYDNRGQRSAGTSTMDLSFVEPL